MARWRPGPATGIGTASAARSKRPVKTERAAERVFKTKLADRTLSQPSEVELTADSLFAALGDYWLEDLRTEGRVAQRTEVSSLLWTLTSVPRLRLVSIVWLVLQPYFAS